MRQFTITRVTRVQRVPITYEAIPQRRKRRGFHPSTHDFFLRLTGAAVLLLILVPLFYYMAKTW